MASFKNKHLKIRILCERAEKEEQERENLEAIGKTQKEIDEIIRKNRTNGFKQTQKTEPWEENEKVVGTLHATTHGLIGTHKVKSAADAFNEKAQKRLDKYKVQKDLEKKGLDSTAVNEALGKTQEQLDHKQKKRQAQFEHDQFIRTQNFRDHLTELHNGMDTLNKIPSKSHYGEQFGFTNNMQELCDNVNFDHHLLKNDLKWYSEAYVKHKGTMRK